MTNLSPQAQVVLDAYSNVANAKILTGRYVEAAIAAALRAVADQVAPSDGSRRTKEIRAELLAIATELDNL